MTQLLRFKLRGYRPPKLIFGAFALCLLAGCKGSSDKDEGSVLPPPEPQTAIYSEDIAEIALSGSTSEIAVGPHVSTSDNSSFRIVSVASLSGEQCQITDITDETFDVVSDDTQDCIFRYQVSPASGDSTSYSYARVAVASTYASSTLPRITASTIEGADITIDLEVELGASVPDSSFELQEDMVVIGSGTAEYINSKQIRFSPSGKGQSEIHYSYQSAEALKVGTISVSVSQLSANTAPSADSFAHDKLLALGESVVIDVGGYVDDVDGDDVQLIAIEDFNSMATLYDAADTTNTKFTFSSKTPGPHDVAYTVSDHRGAYTTSVARIEVEPDFSLIQDWEDIVTHDPVISSDIRLFAPMSKVYADYVNASYTSTHIESGEKGPKGSEVVMQTLKQARAYCKIRGGRLPLQRELDSLITNETSAFITHNWPTEVNYWTAEKVSELNAATASLFDGATGQQAATDVGYTTCVDMSNPSVKDFSVSPSLISASGNEYSYQLLVNHPDGGTGEFQDIELEALEENGVFSSGETHQELVADSTGKQSVSYFDTAFNSSVISSLVSSTNELYPFVPDEDASSLETQDGSKWNHVDTRFGHTPPPIGANGIPVLYNYSAEKGMGSSSVYKEHFIGSDFVMALHIRNKGTLSYGAISFFIEQQGNMPDSTWYNPANDPERDQPGAPQTEDTFNIVTQYAKQEFNFYSGFDNFVGNTPAEVRYVDRYLWFQKKGDMLYHYSSPTPERPSEPEFVGTFDWGAIDPTQPYWVGAGGATNYEDVEAYIVNANFSSYL